MELNKIYNENCLDTMQKMPDNFVDLTVTSPPYDNLRDYNGYSFPFEDIAKELYRVTKTGGVVVWVVGDATIDGSETGSSFRQALHFMQCGFALHDTMIYAKNGFRFPCEIRYHQVWEYMFVFSKGKPKTFNPISDRPNINVGQKVARKSQDRNKDGILKPNSAYRIDPNRELNEMGKRYNIWFYDTGGMNSAQDAIASKHPAIFPEELARDNIYSWSNENDIVYDCFGGSGTTGKMAHLQKRNWILSEISGEYAGIATKRIAPYLAQLKLAV